ncbi:hypothetical protein [Pseudoalteromonas maricaloris]|uniref:hypothetical protein n=1 Tax=Pseudoalteromonas maricaloris TaxID=184924 RepID=UPI00057D8858|nr:hypothetical protein [Pseudoalteromonas flavipulchra]KID36222.1 hypothetical protein QT15_11425 [Pseudoalteromonas flavipulchra NCIMB 2033 = ATCC BAA-314]MBD0780392.1 hypothetical protein [Pseudoalteromonas flavipulchra]MBE0371666.1 hypothetical protein [Pseudoalteromonas flavipulchra NCIMB 2033 = ATCC BAA-314]
MDISNWKNRKLEELSLLELAYAHLCNQHGIRLKDGNLESILPVILQEISSVRYRDRSKNFLPVAGAFSVIEQIGFCYINTEKPKFTNDKASCIKKSLHYFSGLMEGHSDVEALYALRNSYLHNASLMAKAQFPKKPSYYFQYDNSLECMVQEPSVPWSGDISKFKASMTTFINPSLIIDLAESVAEEAANCLEKGTLEVVLESKEPELYYRYLKLTR